MNNIKVITIDLETTGLDPWHDKILLIGYRLNGEGPVYQVKIYDGEIPDEVFIRSLADPTITKRGHNTHFDLLFLVANGYTVNGPIDDTRILAYLHDPSQELDLKTLVEKKLHRKVVRMEDFGKSRIKKHSKKYLKKYGGVTNERNRSRSFYPKTTDNLFSWFLS